MNRLSEREAERLALGLLLVALICASASCSLRLRGREAVGWSPEADLWLHYPMGGSNAVPVPAPH